MAETVKFQVSGRVQNVFFRASTKQQADILGISGWVRNCADGGVEGMASGRPEQLALFGNWLGHGPAMAQVKTLRVDACDYQPFDGFTVR